MIKKWLRGVVAPWCSGKCIRHGSVGREFDSPPGHTKDLKPMVPQQL